MSWVTKDAPFPSLLGMEMNSLIVLPDPSQAETAE